MLKTRITELFGIERPIVQGDLTWIARSELAVDVANAGGIGFMKTNENKLWSGATSLFDVQGRTFDVRGSVCSMFELPLLI